MNDALSRPLLVGLTPRARCAVEAAANAHALRFLARLLAQAQRDGPDGRVVRNKFDLSVLELLVAIQEETLG